MITSLRTLAQLAAAAFSFALVLVSGAKAQTLDATHTGWVNSSNAPSGILNPNYVVGSTGGSFYRNFATFDIPTLTGPLLSASIRYFNPSSATAPGDGYTGGSAVSTFEVFGVSSVSTANLAAHLLTFADLTSGGYFGSTTVDSSSNGSWVTVDLSGALSLQYIVDHAGSDLAFGGSLASESYVLFGFSGNEAHTWAYAAPQLVLVQGEATPVTAVPEPSTYGLIGAGGLLGLLGLRRRRAARKSVA